MNRKTIIILAIIAVTACVSQETNLFKRSLERVFDFFGEPVEMPLAGNVSPALARLLADAKQQVGRTISYDPAYRVIGYRMGDVDVKTGVCADVVVRVFRAAGLDLQQAVHEDMALHFSSYPKLWGLKKPDSNIDHRRVPNIRNFFNRNGNSLAVSTLSGDYLPGDVVSWDLNGNNLSHIGLVSNFWSNRKQRYLIIHNIGSGVKIEDRLFEWKITGHYRYF